MWERGFSHSLDGTLPDTSVLHPKFTTKISTGKAYLYYISTCKIVDVEVLGSLRQTATDSLDPDKTCNPTQQGW